MTIVFCLWARNVVYPITCFLDIIPVGTSRALLSVGDSETADIVHSTILSISIVTICLTITETTWSIKNYRSKLVMQISIITSSKRTHRNILWTLYRQHLRHLINHWKQSFLADYIIILSVCILKFQLLPKGVNIPEDVWLVVVDEVVVGVVVVFSVVLQFTWSGKSQ